MIKVKICGITNLKDAKAAEAYGANAIGFVFAKSPRRIKPQTAAVIVNKLFKPVKCVGVFVNAPVKTVEKISKQCNLDILQFHGNESSEYCRYFRKRHKVIKAFRIKNRKDLKALQKYKVDGYLLDTFVKGKKGGTGRVFDWNIAREAKKIVNPVILSGGLNPENVACAVKSVRPYMVDVSSGVEIKPGIKDIKLIKDFMKAVKK